MSYMAKRNASKSFEGIVIKVYFYVYLLVICNGFLWVKHVILWEKN